MSEDKTLVGYRTKEETNIPHPNMPEIPEGYVLLGEGTKFVVLGGSFNGGIWSPEWSDCDNQWEFLEELTGTIKGYYYIAHVDSLLNKINKLYSENKP